MSLYTTGYEDLAHRLHESLREFNLPTIQRHLLDRGSWAKNCAAKADYLLHLLEGSIGMQPFVWIDADAVVRGELGPVSDELWRNGTELAAHRLRRPGRPSKGELLTGTLWLRRCDRVLALLRRWVDRLAERTGEWDQKALDLLLPGAIELGLRFAELPPSWCWIFDTHPRLYPEDGPPVIEHYQASREVRRGERMTS